MPSRRSHRLPGCASCAGTVRRICNPIHSIRKPTAFCCWTDESGRCRGTFHHFSIQPRQHIAEPCIALKTGCPRMGVWRPSFSGSAGASFVRTKSSACRRSVSSPMRSMYAKSSAVSRNRLRNLDFASRSNASALVLTALTGTQRAHSTADMTASLTLRNPGKGGSA